MVNLPAPRLSGTTARGAGARRGRFSRLWRPLSVWRLIGAFAGLGLVPLALLTYFAVHLSDQAVVHEVNARVRTTASVSAVLVRQEMQGLRELTVSYAGRARLFTALGDGNRAHFNNLAIDRQLHSLAMAQPGISDAVLADTGCRLADAEPANPGLTGVNFSYRDWCTGVKARRGPYVSAAYRTALAGHALVVAVATPVRKGGDPAGRPVGILFVVYPLHALQAFAEQLARVQGIGLRVTDQHGTVLAGDRRVASSGLVSVAADPRVRAALAGRSGLSRARTSSGATLSAFSPVAGLGWTVTAEVPASVALAGVHGLRSTVLIIAALLGLGLLAGLLLLARTLVQRREAERNVRQREASTRAILDAGTDAYVCIDAAGAIKAWNRQAREIFGWTESEARGRHLSEMIGLPHRREAFQRSLANFVATGEDPMMNHRVETTALHRDGHEMPVEFALWPVRSRDIWTFNALMRDISERKRAETELATARDQALEASRLKSEFLANMSHEIRTPLNGVLGMTSLLLDSELDGEQREFAETVRLSGEALLILLNDILDFSKIEAGHLDLESIDFDLRSLMEDVAGLLSLTAHTKGLELACSLPVVMPTFRGDPGRLRQVVTNLVGNAVKFTAAGEVLLEVTVAGEGHGEAIVRFEVTDTGIGIAQADQNGLFDLFSQVDASTTRHFGGTGLGLAISRQLVELMNGQIGVSSDPGRGSTFWFTVPLPRGQLSPAAVPRAGLSGLRMLVVDDSATNRAILTRFLHSWGVRSQTVVSAPQAERALAAGVAARDPFDVVLLDLNRPSVDGVEPAHRISSTATAQPVRTVMLTSSGLSGEAILARDAGIAAYVTKPVRQSQLYDCLVTVMHGSAPVVVRNAPGVDGPRASTPRVCGHVLVAEDNLVNQQVAKAMLTRLGYQVDIVTDGAEAVRSATRTAYQAVLMDCQMPILDGYAATGQIRRLQDGSRHTPIIAVTASAMKSDRQRCLAAGMDDYITKPLRSEALAAALARWVPSGPLPTIEPDPEAPVRLELPTP